MVATKADFLLDNIGLLLVMPKMGGPRRGAAMRDVGCVPGAAVAARDGVVVASGPRDEVMRQVTVSDDATVIDAGGALVTPGLVDAHTHLAFGGWRHQEYAMRAQGKSYLEIAEAGGGIASSVAATRNATEEHLLERTLGFMDEMLRWGTTSAETKSGYGLDLPSELKQLRVIREANLRHPVDLASTFLGAHAVAPEYKDDREGFIESVLDMMPVVRDLGLASFVDVFCDAGAFTVEESRRILSRAKELGFALKLHADELQWTGATELGCELGATSCDHLLKVSDAGIKMLAESGDGGGPGTVAVLLPATSLFLGKTAGAPARRIVDSGGAVALGTDFNPGSSTAISMQLVMTVACSELGLSPEEAFAASTWNSAWSSGLGTQAGSLSPGYWADAVIFLASHYNEVPYRLGWNMVGSVVKKGKLQ